MAFGLLPDSGSSQINGEVLGGLVTGTNGEFLALPVSSTVLGGLSGLTTNQWSKFYLSDSFGTASGSVIQALNYLSASIKENADADVEGPASSNDTAIARFDGTSGKIIQNTSQILISDAGALSSSATAHFVDGMTGKNLAVTGAISGATLAVGGDEFTVTQVGAVAGGAGGDSYSLAANGAISGANAITAGTSMTATTSISGGTLAIGGDEFTVSQVGAVAGGAGGDSYSLAANGAISGANSIIAGTTVSGAGGISGQTLTLLGATVDIAGKMVVSGVLAGNNNISSSAALIAGTTISGAGVVSGQSLAIGGAANLFSVGNDGTVEGGAGGDSYTITAAGVISGANSITAGTTISGAGAASAQSLTVDNALKVNIGGILSSSVGATLGNLILQDESTSLVLSGSMTGSGLATFSNTTTAQGGGYKAAVIVSSSAISTADDAASIPRMVLQGTDDLGNLSDFIISVSGGILRADKLSPGTWPL